MMRRLRVALPLLLALACNDAARDAPEPLPPAAPAPVEAAAMTVYFTRNEQPVAVTRPVADSVTLQAAIQALLAGPTDGERAVGLTSWFSAATAGRLRSAHVDSAGHAIVDFQDLAAVIPSASSSSGSSVLLEELNRTVFALPAVQSVEYRSDGSCEAFWNWLQYDCQVVRRPTP